MKVRFFLFLVLCLGVSGCAEEHMEMVFFGGGEAGKAGVGSTITGVPEELQLLFWGDRDALVEELLGLPEHADEPVPVSTRYGLGVNGVGLKGYMKIEEAQEYLLEWICMIDQQRAYYTKYIDAGGVAIIGHYRVDDAHFYNARDIILIMTSKRPELRERLTPYYEIPPAGTPQPNERYPSKFRMILFDLHQPGFPTMPEYPNGFGPAGWCGATCQVGVSAFPNSGGRLRGYMILVHEFAHAIHSAINDFNTTSNVIHSEVNALDPTFQPRLEAAYAVALANAAEEWPSPLGFLAQYSKRSYAMTNDREYWAEGVREWFEYAWLAYEGELVWHDDVLKRDPLLYGLLDEWLPQIDLGAVE